MSVIPAAYRELLVVPGVKRALLAGVLLRLPGAAMFPVLTLLCVLQLKTSYAEAGIVAAAFNLTGGALGPIRGRSLDRRGVRRTGLPLIPLGLVCWLVMPNVPFWGVVLCAIGAAVANLQPWGIARQLVMRAAPEEMRTAALSLDSVGTEFAFIVGPVVSITLATQINAGVAVTVAGLAMVASLVGLCWVNPTLVKPERLASDDADAPTPRAALAYLGALNMVIAATLIGTDIILLAKLQEAGQTPFYALAAATWAGGSLLGGLIYGARNQRVPSGWLTMTLGVMTIPLALATGYVWVSVAAFVAGLACAPVLTATTDELTSLIPGGRQAEALGWMGSLFTVGGMVGSVGVGAVIDHGGSAAAAAALGASAAVLGGVGLVMRARRAA